MSNLSDWRMSRACFAMMLLIQVPLCFPLAAGTSTTDQHVLDGTSEKPLRIAAITPSATNDILPLRRRVERHRFREKLNEARAILKDLRTFASIAQRAIRAGRKINTLRLENKRLKQGIANHAVSRRELEHNVVRIRTLTNSLTSTVVANWLTSLKLNHQDIAGDKRFISARANWVKIERRLISLRKQVTARREETLSLRARRAALAAEIGRTRRQIINLKDQTRLLDENRKTFQAMTRQLRHDVSGRLRAILVVRQQ